MTPVLDVSRLTVGLSSRPVLQDVSLSIEAGELVALVGPSGSGKSTLALAILDLLPRGATREGSIRVGGTETRDLDDAAMCAIRGRRVSIVFQDPAAALDPVRPIGRQVAAAVLAHAAPSDDALQARVLELLVAAGLDDPDPLLGALPSELSGGQRQRVAIAIALANDPDLVIADEPTTALDAASQARVLDTLVEARRRSGGALLLITHDLAVTASRVDRVVGMRDGSIVDHVDDRAPLPPLAVRPPRSPSVVVARSLSKRFTSRRRPAVEVLHDVSFEIAAGRTLGLVGPSGSGKTTVARLLVGLLAPDAGSIERPPGPGDVGVVFQDPARSLDPRLRVEAIVAEPLRIGGVPGSTVAPRVTAALDDVRLPAATFLRRYPHQLSLGEAQRVAIARAIVTRPRVLVLDEPVSALDATTRRDVLQLLLDLQERHDLAYLFISHDHGVIEQVADEVLDLGVSRRGPRTPPSRAS